MTDYLTEQLTFHFGFKSFRKGQREAIEAALNANHTLVMLPTGTGKSLCYALTGKILKSLTVIVSPLLSLMQDQVTSLKQQGIKKVAAITSMQTAREKADILSDLTSYEFIFLSPEMLTNDGVLNVIAQQKIGLFVVDEAHCISQWGMDFRPEYLQLGEVRQKLGNPLTMALTATATEDVRKDIKTYLFQNNEIVTEIIYPVDRENIAYHVEICAGDKYEKLVHYAEYLKKPGIVYFSSKQQAEEVARILNSETGNRVVAYHGGLDYLDRAKIQANFLNGKIDIICATSAFGMGINKENIRFVIHYHIPGSPEDYIQEVGRAGRDGEESLAILMYEAGDERIQRFFIDTSLPSKGVLENIYNGKYHQENENIEGVQLANYLYKSQVNLDEAQEKVRERYYYKSKQLKVMLDYVHTNSCYRDFLLSYFNEHKTEKIENCCSNDNSTLVLWYLDEKNILSHDKSSRELSWRDIMDTLF